MRNWKSRAAGHAGRFDGSSGGHRPGGMPVWQPNRTWISDQQAQHPLAGGQVAYFGMGARIDAMRDELDQLAIAADHAKSPVLGAGKMAGGNHNPFQSGPKIQVCADPHHRVQKTAQPLPAGHHLGDAVEQLLEKLIQTHPGKRRQTKRRPLLLLRHPPMLNLG